MLGSVVFVRVCHNGILKFAHNCYRDGHLVYEWVSGGCDVMCMYNVCMDRNCT